MDGVLGPCHSAGCEKTKTTPPIDIEMQRFRQLCNLIPAHLVPTLARETGVDKKARNSPMPSVSTTSATGCGSTAGCW